MKNFLVLLIILLLVSGFTFTQENYAPDRKGFHTRIGTIIQTEMIPSLTKARDIGGCIVTNTGRIVIAAGASDIKQNHPFKIAITDNGGKTFKEVFTMHPENSTVTYHANGIAYDPKQNLIVCFFGRTEGVKIFDYEKYQLVPFSIDKTGKNDAVLALSWDNGLTWHIDKRVSLFKHEHTSGMIGGGVVTEGAFYFPHVMVGVNQNKTEWRASVYLAKFNPIKLENDGFTGELDLRFRTFSSADDIDIRYSDETVYIEKLDGTGYISFTRSQPGPPYRREYDLNHNPINEFARCKTVGFDPRDFDKGRNGPMLIAFNVVRLADGNIMYSSRYYGTAHHRAGNIFMTSTDEGKTWQFKDDYIPWNLNPLTFSNIGSGGNPQMSYAPDGSLVHITSQGFHGENERKPEPGGFALCKFKGIDIKNDSGIISIDVSTIAKIEDVFVAKISVTESAGVKMQDETTKRYTFSKDMSQVYFSYEKTAKEAYIQLEIVLANKTNNYRPVFNPRIEIP